MRWSKEEEETLKQLYPHTPNREIAQRLKRSQHSIEMKAKRLKLTKQSNPPPPTPQYLNQFTTLTREEATKRDKIELLRYSWSLIDLYKKELTNPKLTETQRHKIMSSMGNMINIINSIMRYTPDEVFMEKPDLKQQFIEIVSRDQPIRSRRIRLKHRKKPR